MAPYSSTLAWEIPWTEEPGRLQSMGSLGVGHDWATSLSLFTFMHWRRKWQPTPVFLPGESQGWGSLVGCRLWGGRVGHDWSDLSAAAAACRTLVSWPGIQLRPSALKARSLIHLTTREFHAVLLTLCYWEGTGRKARGLQTEEIGCKCQTFFFFFLISLLSGRRKQSSDIFFLLLYTNLKRGFS